MHLLFLHFVEVSTHGGLLGGGDGNGGGGVGGAEGGSGSHKPQVFLHFCSFAAS